MYTDPKASLLSYVQTSVSEECYEILIVRVY